MGVADYYTFREFTIGVRGSRVTVAGKPGVWSWDRLNPGTAALLEVAEFQPTSRVLDLGCGTGVIGAAVSVLAPQRGRAGARRSQRGHVRLVDCSVTAVACAERTLAANGAANASVQLSDGVTGLSSASFDVVLSHLPRGRAVQEQLIRGAAWVLSPGGLLYFVAGKRAGVKGAIEYARGVFGRCGVVRQKKGYHVAMAVKPDAAAGVQRLEPPPPEDRTVTRTITLDGAETTLVSQPGVFAWDRLDAGTEALVSAMEIQAGARVLDLGCGTGLAGLAAARRAPGGRVVLVDADIRAVDAARRTLAANGITNAEVLASDCGAAVLDRRFDVVITNPPFHQGVGVDYEVACQFVRDAVQVLRPGGRLFLVANRFLRYSDHVQKTFGNVATACDGNRYQVLTAVA
jgi:16S rRNA (guanine1207-N2)-methyltransferase